jgi:VanZ family protein
MRKLRLIACGTYVLLLTVLLVTPNPAALLGLHHAPIFPWGKFGIHLTAFIMLAIVAHTARWPAPVGWPLVPLLFYAAITEMLQLLVPQRHARMADFLENSLGILLGTLFYWLFYRLRVPRRARGQFARDLMP